MNNSLKNTERFVTLTLTAIRVVIGIFWLLQLTWKPPPTFGCPNEGFCFWLDQVAKYTPLPFMRDVLNGLVKPNASLFGWLTTFLEVFIGLSMLFGVFTRLGALAGTLWSLVLISGLAFVPNEPLWLYAFLTQLNLFYVAIGGSAQLSIDRAKRLPTWWARAERTISGTE